MKIFTLNQIPIGEKFSFWGTGDDCELEKNDIVYLWQDKVRDGLGTEIIYGTATILRKFQTNYYEAKRIV